MSRKHIVSLTAGPACGIDLYYDKDTKTVTEVKGFDSGTITTTEIPLADFAAENYGAAGGRFLDEIDD